MKRVIIVSNRLPVNITIEGEEVKVEPSVGGLATGMKTVSEKHENLWIGWPGVTLESINHSQKEQIIRLLREYNCIPVFLDQEDFENFYEGFSNKTIWPLFHYFTQYAVYEKKYWTAYQKVNQLFADIILEHIHDGDALWVHDYHLQLLPNLIKQTNPDIPIGFFLHIPFPSYEILRTLPWRNEIMEGLLGADLIGFHTYDYERHFLSSVRRLLGYDINFNEISMTNRFVRVDSFPMGIDYDKFHSVALQQKQKSVRDKSALQQDIENHFLMSPQSKLVLSIDRLDYSKGIANRLHAFEYFLDKFPEFHGIVSFLMICVPSRSNVEQYQLMKSEVDELVGKINGKFSNMGWTPIWYFYRSFPFENLIDLYSSCDIALLTPIRDGMNLVAKEYIASRTDKTGVLILSEMAGAVKEMSEALIINPNNFEEIANALKEAIQMSDIEQIERNTIMQDRLKRYDVNKWANDFLDALDQTETNKQKFMSKKITQSIENEICEAYKKAGSRILFLDYDGTLVGFKGKPEQASPDGELIALLDHLAANPKNELVLISGRDKDTFDKWFPGKNYSMITEHGVWTKDKKTDWELIEPMASEWKKNIKPGMQLYVDRTPGSFIEEKTYSLVWHFRKTDPELGARRAIELKDELTSLTANHNLEILEGNKVIEIKNSGVNKGRAALKKIGTKNYGFVMGIGDDWTDEYMFEQLPENAYTIKVGMIQTRAFYNVENYLMVRRLLNLLAGCE
jgi:trehalose 6-phosphate synthase/phosphatase